MRFIILVLCFVLILPNVVADDALKQKIEAALNSEDRPENDKKRDANRKALATLEFLQLKDDMRVLELVPGGGWYTRVLAPVLKENGQLFIAVGTGRLEEGLLKEEGFEDVKVLEADINFERSGPFRTININEFTLSEGNMDMALTFRNLHNFTEEGRKIMNTVVFDALKSGGLYGVVDHTQRHMEPMTNESRRRIDPIIVIKEILEAGFEFVDYSDVHYRPDDELRYEVGRKSVTGNTDRFTFLFRKP